MTNKKIIQENCECNHIHCKGSYSRGNCGGSGAVYGFGVMGALVYFYPQMIGFSGFITGVAKSLVWPALLVYQALILLKL